MDTLNSELWNLNCAGSPFYETEVWTESSYCKNKTKLKQLKKKKTKGGGVEGGKDSKESQQVSSKRGDFGKKNFKNILGKINAHKGKLKGTQPTKKQGTEFSAIYWNSTQVSKFDLVGSNTN